MFIMLFIGVLVFAVVAHEVSQKDKRDPPGDEVLVTRRWMWLLGNVVALGTQAVLYVSIWEPLDGEHLDGPGDGLFLMLFVILPWLLAMALNACAALVCTRTLPGAVQLWCLSTLVWFGAMSAEDAILW